MAKCVTLYWRNADVGYAIPTFPQLKALIERFCQEGRIRIMWKRPRIHDCGKNRDSEFQRPL